MLEYSGIRRETLIKMFFVDEESPKELKSMINDKLSDYYENAYVDMKTEGSKDILIILELNPPDKLDDEFIRKHRDVFEKYYNDILNEIGSSNQSSNKNDSNY